MTVSAEPFRRCRQCIGLPKRATAICPELHECGSVAARGRSRGSAMRETRPRHGSGHSRPRRQARPDSPHGHALRLLVRLRRHRAADIATGGLRSRPPRPRAANLPGETPRRPRRTDREHPGRESDRSPGVEGGGRSAAPPPTRVRSPAGCGPPSRITRAGAASARNAGRQSHSPSDRSVKRSTLLTLLARASGGPAQKSPRLRWAAALSTKAGWKKRS